METKELTQKEEWLEDRKTGIGGSDIGTILGLNSKKSPYQLWEEKTGKTDGSVDNNFTRAGIKLEPMVADWFAETTGLPLSNPGQNITRHKDFDFVLGTPDRITYDSTTNKAGILEIKTTGKIIDPEQIPLMWFCQVIWYAGIKKSWNDQEGYDYNHIAWWERLTCAFNFIPITFDQEFSKYLIEKADEFWSKYVLADTPPPPTNLKDLQILYARHQPGKSIIATDELQKSIAELKTISEAIKAAKDQEAIAKLKIQMIMGDCESVINEDGIPLVTWKSAKDSLEFDTERFKAEHPELFRSFQIPKAGSRRFLVK